MPVLLTTPDEQAAWLTAPEEALKLQWPLPDDALRIVAKVEKADEWMPAVAGNNGLLHAPARPVKKG